MKTRIKKMAALLLIMGIITANLVGCTSSATETTEEIISAEESTDTESTANTAAVSTDLVTVEYKDSDLDSDWDEASSTLITCNGTGAEITGTGATVSGSTITITTEGTYVVSGTLEDGQIVVEAAAEDNVRIVLNGADITCSDSAAIYGSQSDKIVLILAEGTTNTISDGSTYAYADADEDEPNAAIFSKDGLTINGTGTLIVNGNYSNGISSKDDLKIVSGTIEVTAVNDGIKGKDLVAVQDADITINAGGDGISASNDTEAEKGYVVLEGGNFLIQADGKGLKAVTILQITGGTYQIDSADDALHSNANVVITAGEMSMTSEDDGIHATSALVISGGTIAVTESYEGLEGQTIDIQGGDIEINASDDGVNASGGNDASAEGGQFGADMFSEDTDAYVRISGGTLHVNADGDGLDSNGSLYIDGGETYVEGPTNDGNGTLDYNGVAEITGGIIVASGSSGMAQTFSDTSTQASVIIYYTESQSAGSTVSLQDDSGNEMLSFTPTKDYAAVVISTPDLATGNIYTLVGDSINAEFTLADTITSISSDGSAVTGAAGGTGGHMGGGGDKGPRTQS